MKKPLTRKALGNYPLASMDPKAFEKFPATRQFFTAAQYEGTEEERRPGTLILRAEDSQWVAVLKEPTAAQQVTIAAPTLGDLWKLIEAALESEQTPWVTDSWQQARNRPTRRKGG